MSPRRAEPASERTLVYGRNAIREALRGRRRVFELWGTQAALADLERQVSEALPASTSLRPEELTAMCGSPSHQGLVAAAAPYPYADAAALLEQEDPLIVALDQVQDPQNLGAVCRTAEAAGATGLVVPERGAAAVTGAVCRASAGAVEHLPVARVGNLANFLGQAKKAGAWVYGAEAGAPGAYTETDYTGPVVLVFGSEGRGLRPRVSASCDALVSLPVKGRVGSLNVSAAAAVVLYEAVRQRSA